MVPVGDAHLDNAREEVVLNGMNRAALLNLPDYDGRTHTSDTTRRSGRISTAISNRSG